MALGRSVLGFVLSQTHPWHRSDLVSRCAIAMVEAIVSNSVFKWFYSFDVAFAMPTNVKYTVSLVPSRSWFTSKQSFAFSGEGSKCIGLCVRVATC